MKRFLNNRTRHATTALVLIVWLFGLGLGIANACLLEARGSHSHVAGTEKSGHTHGFAKRSAETIDIDDDAHASPRVKALCLDACDERTNALPKQDTSVGAPLLASLAVFAIVWIANQPVESTVRFERDTHADPFGIPIRVRYSRLTL